MGYDKDFIHGLEVPLPALGDRALQAACDLGKPVEHTRFTLVLNQERGFAIYTAHNLDGATLIPAGEIARIDRFMLDPLVPSDVQIDNDRAYSHNPWDRGHLVQRRSLHWGDYDEAVLGDRESFYWTNITPQHENLHDTAWGSIEDWMLEYTDVQDKQASVFTGPVLSPDDPEIVNRPGELPVRIPAGFWKVIAIKTAGRLKAAGFLVWQRDYDSPTPVLFDPQLEQVRITTIEFLAGISFGTLRIADPLYFGAAPVDEPVGLTAVRATRRSKPAFVSSSRDIVI